MVGQKDRSGKGRRDVRFGSKADTCAAIGHVRFTPESGHVQCNSACPLSANTGHLERYSTLLKLVAIRGNVWCAGHIIACAALHEIRLVRMPE